MTKKRLKKKREYRVGLKSGQGIYIIASNMAEAKRIAPKAYQSIYKGTLAHAKTRIKSIKFHRMVRVW